MANATISLAAPVVSSLPFVSDWMGGISVFLTVVGFCVTVWNVRKSKKAADQAKDAVNLVSSAILKYNTVADLSSAIAKLDEVKRLHRLCGWEILAERYSDTRKVISSINQPSYKLTEEQQAKLQNATTQLSKMEYAVDKAVSDGPRENSLLHKNSKILSGIIDDVITIIVFIKNQ